MPNNVIMRMDRVKSYFTAMVEVKRSHEAASFMISLIEDDLRDYVKSPDFQKLPLDTQEDIAVSRARAIRYWNIQLDDFMEKNTSAWINAAKTINAEELKITLDEVLQSYGVKKTRSVKSVKPAKPVRIVPAIDEVIEEDIAEEPDSDADILATLMADQ